MFLAEKKQEDLFFLAISVFCELFIVKIQGKFVFTKHKNRLRMFQLKFHKKPINSN